METVEVAREGTVLVTRERARVLAGRLPLRSEVCLDFEGVGAASPSFLDELRQTALSRGIRLRFSHLSPRMRETMELLDEVRQPA